MAIRYKIKLEKQGIQECVQASASQLLSYYGIEKSINEIKDEVPVYINTQGVKQGTSLGHIAAYIQSLGIKTTIHSSDIVIFDPTWKDKSSEELLQLLSQRKAYVKHGIYDEEAINLIVDGYTTLLRAGGDIDLSIVDSIFIQRCLEKGPLFLVVSYNSLNNCAKYEHEQGKPTQDSIKGIPSTHAIIISGYKNGIFDIVDPDFEYGGYRKIPESRLIAAYYLAETDMDCMFMSFEK